MTNTATVVLLDLTLNDLLAHHKNEAEKIENVYHAATLMNNSPIVIAEYKNKLIFHVSAMKSLQRIIDEQKQ